MGYDLNRVVAVDDTPSKYQRQYGNLVRIHPCFGEKKDNWLDSLLVYLRELNLKENVRKVEKRGWKTKMEERK